MLADVTSIVIRTEGVCLLLADAQCPVNLPTFWERSRAPAWRFAEITRLVREQRVVVLEMVMDGVFRIDVKVLDAPPSESLPGDPVVLEVPSGRLTMRSASETREVVVVPSGRYEGVIDWDVAWESKHYDVPSISEYPEGEGPDGSIVLWRTASGNDG
jgi:hypothetical protein